MAVIKSRNQMQNDRNSRAICLRVEAMTGSKHLNSHGDPMRIRTHARAFAAFLFLTGMLPGCLGREAATPSSSGKPRAVAISCQKDATELIGLLTSPRECRFDDGC